MDGLSEAARAWVHWTHTGRSGETPLFSDAVAWELLRYGCGVADRSMLEAAYWAAASGPLEVALRDLVDHCLAYGELPPNAYEQVVECAWSGGDDG